MSPLPIHSNSVVLDSLFSVFGSVFVSFPLAIIFSFPSLQGIHAFLFLLPSVHPRARSRVRHPISCTYSSFYPSNPHQHFPRIHPLPPLASSPFEHDSKVFSLPFQFFYYQSQYSPSLRHFLKSSVLVISFGTPNNTSPTIRS